MRLSNTFHGERNAGKGKQEFCNENYSSNKVIRNLIEEVAFQQRPEGSKGENAVVI